MYSREFTFRRVCGQDTPRYSHIFVVSESSRCSPTGLVLQALGSGRAFADIADTAGATVYRWYVKAPGSADFVFKVETATSEALLLSLTLGANEVRVTAVGTGGESLPSAPVSLNVI